MNNSEKCPLFTQVETEYMEKLHRIKINADVIGAERVKRIAEACLHATTKHPKFADVYCEGDGIKRVQDFLKWVRKVNDHAKVHNASLILIEETTEAKEQYLLGNYDECLNELYQVVAVVLRMIHFVENKQ